MLKFVVVEDDKELQNSIINVIDKTMFKTNHEYLIEKYNMYCTELQKSIDDGCLQKIYILDIDLGNEVSGLDIAKNIRKSDWDSEIIFLSSHDKMFETVYRTIFKVFDFIEKFMSFETRLEQNICKIISQKVDYGKFCYSNTKVNIQIYYKDITYIYRDTAERKIVIKTTNNEFLLNKTIAEMASELDSRFQQVHRACIVNTERVHLFNWSKGYFVLDNGKTVHLCSKLYKEQVIE